MKKSTRKRYSRPKRGDVFELPAPDGRRGLGQVVRDGDVMYVIVFEGIFRTLPDCKTLRELAVLLAAWTTDSWFFHGRWSVCMNCPVAENNVPLPSYLIQINGEHFVQDFDGKIIHPATTDNVRELRYRSNFAPIRLQNAFLANNGLGEWDDSYGELSAETAWQRVLRS